MKITSRCGEAVVTGLNEALLVKAAAATLLRTDKVRADTTVIPAAVAYPTGFGSAGQGDRFDGPHRGADQSRRRRVPHSVAGPAALGRAPGPVHCREAAAAR
jgi:IS5 family transposase